MTDDLAANPCLTCGACCAYAADWPRFTLETDAALDRIPAKLVNDALSGMRWKVDRCAALTGEIGQSTTCAIYDIRPDVCHACQPGDDACTMARQKFGMKPITAPVLRQ